MKTYINLFLVFSLLVFAGCSSVAPKNDNSQLPYPYTRLRTMDLDQMNDLMLEKAKEFKRTNDPQALKDGLLICLSRPDEDGVVDKVIGTVRTPLEDNDIWESTVENLINESIAVIHDNGRSSVDQVSYSLALENLISELRPDFIKQYKSPGFETRMIEKIASVDTELSASAKAERKLNLMRSGSSASQIAQRLIEKRDQALKAEKKKKDD